MNTKSIEYGGVLVCGQGLQQGSENNTLEPNRNMAARLLVGSELWKQIAATQVNPPTLYLGGGDVFKIGTPISEIYSKFIEQRLGFDPRFIQTIPAFETIGELQGTERVVAGRLVIVSNGWHRVADSLAQKHGHVFFPIEEYTEDPEVTEKMQMLLTRPLPSERFIQFVGQQAIRSGGPIGESLYRAAALASLRYRAVSISPHRPLPF